MIFRGSFLVRGTPRMPSSKPQTKDAWRALVTRIARNEFSTIMHNPIQVKVDITYYYDEIVDFDLDNMCKLILDSMNGIVYDDDNQVADLNPRRKRKMGSFRISNPPTGFIDSMASRESFVVIEVYEIEEDEL